MLSSRLNPAAGDRYLDRPARAWLCPARSPLPHPHAFVRCAALRNLHRIRRMAWAATTSPRSMTPRFAAVRLSSDQLGTYECAGARLRRRRFRGVGPFVRPIRLIQQVRRATQARLEVMLAWRHWGFHVHDGVWVATADRGTASAVLRAQSRRRGALTGRLPETCRDAHSVRLPDGRGLPR